MRLLPGFSWDDLRDNWKSELDSSEILHDAQVSLLFVFHGILNCSSQDKVSMRRSSRTFEQRNISWHGNFSVYGFDYLSRIGVRARGMRETLRGGKAGSNDGGGFQERAAGMVHDVRKWWMATI
jgi:hypothetical protein